MKITIESTTQVVFVNPREGDRAESGLACRVWEGETESGIKVQCLITRIAASKNDNLAQFERELIEHSAPSADVRAFPLRMII